MNGKQAYEEFKRRLEGRASTVNEAGVADSDDLGVGIDDLIQYNIQGVDCRYSENLHDFWDNVRKNMKRRRKNTSSKGQIQWAADPAKVGSSNCKATLITTKARFSSYKAWSKILLV